jgi:hypothetical protein
MIARPALVALVVALLPGSLAAQQHEERGEHEPLRRHQLAAFTGFTWVPKGEPHEGDPQGTVIVPTLGIDYSFWITHRFGVGLYNDFELSKYVVQTPADTTIPREYAYVGALVAIWEAVRGLELYAGPGVELEKHENFIVLKLGLEYAFARANDWVTGVAFGYDVRFGSGFTREYNSWALGISVARRF